MALQNRHRELEEKQMHNDNWQIEAERYELVQLPPATYLYRVKESARGIEPPHYLCVHCYGKQEKSILQQTAQSCGQTHYTCFQCEKIFKVGHAQSLPSGKLEVEYDLYKNL